MEEGGIATGKYEQKGRKSARWKESVGKPGQEQENINYTFAMGEMGGRG
jgi:hypothetical protein